MTQYAVESRYPGYYEPVTDQEYQQAIQMATRVVDWTKKMITPNSQEPG